MILVHLVGKVYFLTSSFLVLPKKVGSESGFMDAVDDNHAVRVIMTPLMR